MTIIKGSGGFIGFSISVNYFKNIKAFDPKKKKNQYIGATWKKESLYIYIYIYFRRKKEKLMLTIKYCVQLFIKRIDIAVEEKVGENN